MNSSQFFFISNVLVLFILYQNEVLVWKWLKTTTVLSRYETLNLVVIIKSQQSDKCNPNLVEAGKYVHLCVCLCYDLFFYSLISVICIHRFCLFPDTPIVFIGHHCCRDHNHQFTFHTISLCHYSSEVILLFVHVDRPLLLSTPSA